MLARVEEIHEGNPMLGTRGCRLGILYPEIYEMQVRGDRARRQGREAGPHPEIMIPLVAYEHELQIMRELVVRVASEEGLEEREDYTVGTMIELPPGVLRRRPDRPPRRLLLVRHQRPHPDRDRVLARRRRVEVHPDLHREKIIDRSPFETIDTPGVGWLVRLGAWVGREAHPRLKLGICGEHGGDPDSIAFFHERDSTTCPARRSGVPIAGVAAAQAAIAEARRNTVLHGYDALR